MKKWTTCIACCIVSGFLAMAEPIVWDFTQENGLAGGGRFPLVLQGASRLGPTGMEVAEPEKNKPQGASTGKTIHPELSPRSFRLTIDFTLSEKALTRKSKVMTLFDNKHTPYSPDKPKAAGHEGIMVTLDRYRSSFTVRFHVGYGTMTRMYAARPRALQANLPYSLVIDYDGVGGLSFELDGQKEERELYDATPIAPAIHPLSIGDRGTSKYAAFEGTIRRVVLEGREPTPVKCFPKGRYAFERDEPNAAATLRIWVRDPQAFEGGQVELNGAGGITAGAFPFGLNGGQEMQITFPVNTALAWGRYDCKAILTGKGGRHEHPFALFVCPKWHGNDQERGLSAMDIYYDDVKASGCTHLGTGCGYELFTHGQTPSEGDVQKAWQYMDRLMMDGMHATAWCLGPGTYKKYAEEYPVTMKNGEKREKSMEASNPEVQAKILDDVERYARAVGSHPACDMAATSNESRDSSFPNFSAHAREKYRRETGREIPPEVGDSRTGIHYRTLTAFPFTRVVPSDDPILSYYRWFWQDGDGWNPLLGKVAERFAKGKGAPLATMYQPAVRVPPISGSGGPVTYNRHWTYVYPEPYNINYVISEQQNMVASTEGQTGAIASLQCFSYRSQLAPQELQVENPPAWVLERPNATFITTPPDMIREAMWVCFARQLTGIDAKSYKTLYDNVLRGESKLTAAYQFTTGETAEVLKRQFNEVGIPLGPLFRRVPERAPEVAVLESFAATVFAGRGTWGWHGKIYDYGTMLTLANLNPKVLYEENIAKGVPPETKVIVMPDCDVLTEESFAALREFECRGGLIVGDENLVPGLMADFRLPEFNRTKKDGAADDAAIRAGAQALRRDMADYFRPYSDTDKDNLFTLVRTWKKADYLFVINDRRAAGDYIGQYNRMLEKGMPNEGNAILRRKAGAVYDLVAHRSVTFKVVDGETVIPVRYSTNDGKALLVTEAPLRPLSLALVDKAKPDAHFDLTVSTPDKDVLIPIRLEIKADNGYRADESGYAVLEDGLFTRAIHIPVNAVRGTWSITVTNLANGEAVNRKLVLD